MAKGLAMLQDFGEGLATPVVGFMLTQNVTLIPMLPEIVHQVAGWLMVGVGILNLFKVFK